MSETGGPGSIASRCDRWLRDMPWGWFALFAVVATFAKAGVNLIRYSPEPLSSFPAPPESLAALSYGSRTIAWLLGWEFFGAHVYITAAVAGVLLVFLVVTLRPSRVGSDGRLLLLLILLSPIGFVLLNNIGGNDAWVILGALVLGLRGRRIPTAVVGSIIMVLGNPEQAVLATAGLLLLTWTPWLRSRRAPYVAAFVIALTSFLSLSAYAATSGSETRMGYVTTFLGNSIFNFGANLPLSLYATLGVLWIVVAWTVLRSNRMSALLVVIAVVVLPLIIMAVTLDQTRVFVGISTASIVALLTEVVPQMRHEAEARGFLHPFFWTAAAVLFLPALLISFTGTAVVPHGWFFVWVIPALQGG